MDGVGLWEGWWGEGMGWKGIWYGLVWCGAVGQGGLDTFLSLVFFVLLWSNMFHEVLGTVNCDGAPMFRAGKLWSRKAQEMKMMWWCVCDDACFLFRDLLDLLTSRLCSIVDFSSGVVSAFQAHDFEFLGKTGYVWCCAVY